MLNILYKGLPKIIGTLSTQNTCLLLISPAKFNLELRCGMCYMKTRLKTSHHSLLTIKQSNVFTNEHPKFTHGSATNTAKEVAPKLAESLSSSTAATSALLKIPLDSSKQIAKPRLVKKKPKKSSSETSMPTYKVKAIATADYYDLDGLSESLAQSGAYYTYELGALFPETCLCVKPKYQEVNEIEPRHMFFFEDGTVVFWNTSSEEQHSLLETLVKHEENPHPAQSIADEAELMNYSRVVLNKSTYIDVETITSYYDNNQLTKSFTNKHKLTKENKSTRYFNNHIYFSDYIDDKSDASAAEKNHLQEKYAFSDAIALSVKLGIWEQ